MKSQGRTSLAGSLLRWFDRTARDLPWRRTRDLYAIWISEIMLQQTQVATVIPYYERFVARFPTVTVLAKADQQDVLRLWEGLGYYRRARQLHAAAQHIVQAHGGVFPDNYAAVRALPGIGRYTAGAILSIGLDQRLPILEANTIRVYSRLTAFAGDPATAAGQNHLWSIAQSLLPRRRCGAFNQALMELGSEICTPKSPECGACPVKALCAARRLNKVHEIPRPPRKTNYEDVTELAVIVRRHSQVLLRKRQPGERWAGLWDFPRFPCSESATIAADDHIAVKTQELTGIAIRIGQRIATLKHGVTRFRITLHCHEATPVATRKKTPPESTSARWVKTNDLPNYPLTTPARKITQLICAQS